MQGMILAAGYGLRMRPITNFIPKPLLPLFGTPLIEYKLSHFKQFHITNVLINLHHLPHTIENHLGDGRKWGVKIRYLFEENLLGTGGAVENAIPHIDSFPLCLVNGDTFCNINVQDMYHFHHAKTSIASMSVSPLKDSPAERCMWVNFDGHILKLGGFLKQEYQDSAAPIKCDFTGIHLLEKEFIHLISQIKQTPFDINRDVYTRALSEGRPIFAYMFETYWADMGSPKRYFQAHAYLLWRGYPKTVGFREIRKGIFVGSNVHLSESVKFQPPVAIASNSTVLAGTSVGPCTVIGKNCIVEQGAHLGSCIILNHTHIPQDAFFKNAIVLNNAGCPELIWQNIPTQQYNE
jgi:NDP-sugar pyrophosphorylase family protein